MTPTYKKPVQRAELTRLGQAIALSNVPTVWILVMDTMSKKAVALAGADMVKNEEGEYVPEVLQDIKTQFERFPSIIQIVTLHAGTGKHTKHRGVIQRNAGINWISQNNKNRSSVTYFADDDNRYVITF